MKLDEFISQAKKQKIYLYTGTYVIYNNTENSISEHRKGIWEVIDIHVDEYRLKNIVSNNIFSSKKKNLFPIDSFPIQELKEILTDQALTKYEELLNYNVKHKEDKAKNYAEDLNEQLKSFKKPLTNEKEPKMNSMIKRIGAQNTEAAKTGALIVAGKTLNGVVKDKIRGQVPRKYRKLVDHALADIVIANVANVAVQNFAMKNDKAQVAVNAMMEAAMIDFFSSFNIEKIISDVIATVNIEDLIPSTE